MAGGRGEHKGRQHFDTWGVSALGRGTGSTLCRSLETIRGHKKTLLEIRSPGESSAKKGLKFENIDALFSLLEGVKRRWYQDRLLQSGWHVTCRTILVEVKVLSQDELQRGELKLHFITKDAHH